MSNSPSVTTTSMNVADSPAVREAQLKPTDTTPGTIESANPETNQGYGTQSQPAPIVVKETDSRVLQGSHGIGDHRTSGDSVKPAMDRIANPPNPREPVGQFPLSGKQAPAPAPESFLGAEGSDQS
jgi:hypothetical protein